MASFQSRTRRNAAVRKRLEAVITALGEKLGVPVPEPPRPSRDRELQPIIELERFADFGESVLAAIKGDGSEAPAPESAGYADLTVAELRDLLQEREIEVPSDARKADLIAALEQADADEDEAS